MLLDDLLEIIEFLHQGSQCTAKGETNEHSQGTSNWSNKSNCVIDQVFFMYCYSSWWCKVISKIHLMSTIEWRIETRHINVKFNFSRILQNGASFRIPPHYELIEAKDNLIPSTDIFFILLTNRSTEMKKIQWINVFCFPVCFAVSCQNVLIEKRNNYVPRTYAFTIHYAFDKLKYCKNSITIIKSYNYRIDLDFINNVPVIW